jgi:hypothetical protein
LEQEERWGGRGSKHPCLLTMKPNTPLVALQLSTHRHSHRHGQSCACCACQVNHATCAGWKHDGTCAVPNPNPRATHPTHHTLAAVPQGHQEVQGHRVCAVPGARGRSEGAEGAGHDAAAGAPAACAPRPAQQGSSSRGSTQTAGGGLWAGGLWLAVCFHQLLVTACDLHTLYTSLCMGAMPATCRWRFLSASPLYPDQLLPLLKCLLWVVLCCRGAGSSPSGSSSAKQTPATVPRGTACSCEQTPWQRRWRHTTASARRSCWTLRRQTCLFGWPWERHRWVASRGWGPGQAVPLFVSMLRLPVHTSCCHHTRSANPPSTQHVFDRH